MRKGGFYKSVLTAVLALSVLITSVVVFPSTAEAAQTITIYPGEIYTFEADNYVFSMASSNKSVVTVGKIKGSSGTRRVEITGVKPGKTKISGYVGKLSGLSVVKGRKTKTINVNVKKLYFSTSIERISGKENYVRVAVKNDMKQGFMGCSVRVTIRDKNGKALGQRTYRAGHTTPGKTLYREFYLRDLSVSKDDMAKADLSKSTAEVVSIKRYLNIQAKDITSKVKFAEDVSMDGSGEMHFDVTVSKKSTPIEGCYARTWVLFYDKNGQLLRTVSSDDFMIAGTCDYYEVSTSKIDYDHYVIRHQCFKETSSKLKTYQI